MKRIFHKKLSPIQRMSTGDMRFAKTPAAGRRTSFYIAVSLVFFIVLILIIRLFQLTITQGEYYARLSEANRIKELYIEPKYGTIRDRKGFVLAESKPVSLSSMQDFIRSTRTYSYPEETAHLIGYRQIADTQDLKQDSCDNKLVPGEKIGKKGVQGLFDCTLRGVPGKKLVEVNASGREEGTVAIIPPQPGHDIQLAADIDLQKVAYQALKGKKGAVIVEKPSTGEILAFVSTPSYDPNLFETGDPHLSTYFTDTNKPLLDRATEGTYPPGSIFKPLIAAGGLEDKTVTPDTIVEDNGFLTAGSLRFGNWYFLQYGKTEGPVDMVKAIRRSNDTYFYVLGAKMGANGMRTWAERFGLGNTVPFGFDQEEGILPSPFWKTETLHENWYLGDTYNYAIGQGYTLVTPLQMAYALSAFANEGYQCEPQLLKNAPPVCHKVPVATANIDLIKEGMKEACSTGGTGWPLFNFKVRNMALRAKTLAGADKTKQASLEAAMNRNPAYFTPIQTACKTGTAESQSKDAAPHAWIFAFAPYEKPEIMVIVLVENAGQGSDVAGPVAKDIFTAYFERAE